ncbi:MAG: hypothetical protein NZL85_11515 [Fimbriimonadales bacterium]|nr:hypothetical protein [Fimbriimonadales bacterium]
MDRATLDRIDASAHGLTALVVWIGRKRSRLFLPVPALLIGLADPSMETAAAGGTLVLLGSLVRLWAAGYLQKNTHLITAGPYAYVRHPLYGGMLLILMGWCTMVGWLPSGMLLGAYAALLYGCAIVMEERRLSELFPDHAIYHRVVPLLVPMPGRRWRTPEGVFCWRTAWINGEHRILLWNTLVTALILARIWV